MTAPTVPARTAAKMVAACLLQHQRELRQRIESHPGSPKAAGWRRDVARIDRQVNACWSVAKSASVEVDAASAALLAAWALGGTEAIGELERHLEAAGHPAAEKLTEVKSDSVEDAVRLLLGGA